MACGEFTRKERSTRFVNLQKTIIRTIVKGETKWKVNIVHPYVGYEKVELFIDIKERDRCIQNRF